MFKKYLPSQVVSPVQHPEKEKRTCPTLQASLHCLGFEAPALCTDLTGVTAMCICHFPGVLPADIPTAKACLFYLTVLLLLSYHPITAPNYSALKSRH